MWTNQELEAPAVSTLLYSTKHCNPVLALNHEYDFNELIYHLHTLHLFRRREIHKKELYVPRRWLCGFDWWWIYLLLLIYVFMSFKHLQYQRFFKYIIIVIIFITIITIIMLFFILF